MPKIDLGPAHRELVDLLKKLEGMDVSELVPNRDVEGISTSPEAWLEQVKRAERELRGWCRGFGIDVKPLVNSDSGRGR
jgi:hypothetical protein